MKRIKDVDTYIQAKPDFARPILTKLRDIIEQAAPDAEEAIKWRVPCYTSHGLLCSMAAFKQHVNFGFFNAQLIDDPHNLFDSDNETMTSLKFNSIADLPDDAILLDYIQRAVAKNEALKTQGCTKPKPKKDKAELERPEDLSAALNQNEAALQHFEQFSYSKQKDYIQWITSAKREATRQKRLATAIEWISEGKSKNWKYENC